MKKVIIFIVLKVLEVSIIGGLYYGLCHLYALIPEDWQLISNPMGFWYGGIIVIIQLFAILALGGGAFVLLGSWFVLNKEWTDYLAKIKIWLK